MLLKELLQAPVTADLELMPCFDACQKARVAERETAKRRPRHARNALEFLCCFKQRSTQFMFCRERTVGPLHAPRMRARLLLCQTKTEK